MRYWKRVDAQGQTTTVESYSHGLEIAGALEIAEQEFNDFMASLSKPAQPVVDWQAEWQAAVTPETKIEILARKLGIIYY